MKSPELSAGQGERRPPPSNWDPRRAFATPDQFDLWEKFHEKGDIKACGQLVQLNSGLVGRYLEPYRGDDCEPDMKQAGLIGLHTAIRHFNPHLGFRFSTYACYWIRQSIERERPKYRSVIRLPGDVEARISSMYRAESGLAGMSGRLLDDDELTQTTGFGPELVAELRRADRLRHRISSLDSPIINGHDGPGKSLGETVIDPNQDSVEDLAIRAVTDGRVLNLVNRLPEWQRVVIGRFYGFDVRQLPRGVHNIASDLGLRSDHSITKINQRAHQTLTQLMTTPPESDHCNQVLARRLGISVYTTFFRRQFLDLLGVSPVNDPTPDVIDQNARGLIQLDESLARLPERDRRVATLVHGLGGDLPHTHWEVSWLTEKTTASSVHAADKRARTQVLADFASSDHPAD